MSSFQQLTGNGESPLSAFTWYVPYIDIGNWINRRLHNAPACLLRRGSDMAPASLRFTAC